MPVETDLVREGSTQKPRLFSKIIIRFCITCEILFWIRCTITHTLTYPALGKHESNRLSYFFGGEGTKKICYLARKKRPSSWELTSAQGLFRHSTLRGAPSSHTSYNPVVARCVFTNSAEIGREAPTGMAHGAGGVAMAWKPFWVLNSDTYNYGSVIPSIRKNINKEGKVFPPTRCSHRLCGASRNLSGSCFWLVSPIILWARKTIQR